MIAGNIVLNTFSLIINRFFAGDTADTTTEDAQTALAEADKVVRKSAEESIVLLKNEDYLPLKGLDKINLFGWGSTDNGLLLTGGGSGGTTITDTLDDGRARIKVDLTDALKEANIEYNTSLTGEYEKSAITTPITEAAVRRERTSFPALKILRRDFTATSL